MGAEEKEDEDDEELVIKIRGEDIDPWGGGGAIVLKILV